MINELLIPIGKKKTLYPAPPPGSVLYYSGYPPMGATILDRSGQGNTGTITGATWNRLNSGLWGLSFDGSDKVRKDASVVGIGAGAVLAYETWIKRGATGAEHTIMALGPTNQNASSLFYFDATDHLYLRVAGAAAGSYFTTTATYTSTTTWYHILATYTLATDSITIAVNGVNQAGALTQGAIGAISSYTTYLRIGNRYRTMGETSWMNGRIFLPRIYNVASGSHYYQEKHLFGV